MSDENIQQFMTLSNASLETAQSYLGEFPDLGDALNAFYAAQNDNPSSQPASGTSTQEPRSRPSRSLSPKNSPALSQSSSRAAKKSGNQNPKFKSFSDILKETNANDDDDEPRNTFAGGETSGLEVTDPNDPDSLIRDLLEKAKRGGQRSDDSTPDEAQRKKSHFTGKGFRLGSSVDAPAHVADDIPAEPLPSRPQKVTREITFWKEGFQVNDGELYRYDDPANSFYLNELNQGRAPLRLLNVEFGQEVDVNVNKRLDESFKPPKRKLQGFHGTGQRLGSPIPGESLSPEATPQPPAQKSPASKEEPAKPTGDTSVQIRYASGKREVLHCNSTDTVRSLYDHVKGETGNAKAFTLNHAFPVKPIENFDSSLKEEGLCHAVVVQRWV
ncbi:protein phosphatase regulator SHP1 [Lachancea thermotolerans CBS 6340]|uniref:KLTH0C07040p n=1 Tax=Lachancea thermotolerans (strain ATCC 56472 / CBS 6340 / NRRL Y-8284) TaxID=559295 RepID=C5DE82_LACTC|nr:KLTH0C07040p [Lachancea thermotolerans CBS 6340]CAR22093.1 KLTH0C07040p [Lachancea thermotolerans CBS 6340]